MNKVICLMALVACAAAAAAAQRTTAPSVGGRPAPVVGNEGQPAQAEAKVPRPVIVWKGLDATVKGSDGKPYVGVTLGVTNYAAFPAALFAPAPELPPCGATPAAPRAWLKVFERATGREVYTHCALPGPTAMRTFSFNVERAALPAEVYVELHDRAGGARHRSNCLKTADGKPCEGAEGGQTGTVVLAQPGVNVADAFFAVHGRQPNPEEAKQWQAAVVKDGLTRDALVRRILERLTTNPDVYAVGDMRFIVMRAFQAAGKGTPAKQDEDYWVNRVMARNAYYQIILDALKKK